MKTGDGPSESKGGRSHSRLTQAAEEIAMTDLGQLKEELVTANHILAHHHVVDSFGHISVRHPGNPNHFLMSRARAPACTVEGDIMEFKLDGTIVGEEVGKPYSERFIHGAILEARPDVMCVVHNHSPNVVPFTVTGRKMRPIMHMCAPIGTDIPNWDIGHKFGYDTNLLVTNMDMGRDLAKTRDFARHAKFFGALFEGVRRYKVTNPEKMRSSYGKLLYALQDAAGLVGELGFELIQPLETVHAFLARLEAQDFDVFASGGLGPWVDCRPHARLLLHSSLLWHTVRNTF
jgi:ribulose-5-phosphate 4-epimerase/fuculose-1-phosphate aldolase